jgi:hypothetical protein
MAKVANVEKVEKVAISLEVDIDTPFDKVIEFDAKGAMITFEDKPGRFKRLTDAEQDKLRKMTLSAYLVSERYHERALDRANNPEGIPVLKEVQQAARATDRLYVGNKDPGMYYSWKRPDEIKKSVAYEGWVPATDPALDVFRKPVGGVPVTGSKGDDELILMKQPLDLHEAKLRRGFEESEKRRGSFQRGTAHREGLFEEGDPKLDPKGRKWTPLASEQGES